MKSIRVLLICTPWIAVPLAAASCDSLLELKLPGTAITSARTIAQGGFTPPGAQPNDPRLTSFRTLPEFCRVEGVIAPSSDSHIEFEVWLPASGWNRKYLGI